MADIQIHTGDAFDVLPELDANSVHAVVTDPPYGLAFMGRDWDDFEPKEYQAWCEEWARECRRVLRPGGHLLAFSGNRTHHRLFSGVEDAGYEIRDTLTWHYGSGFPKALDVSKAIDKAAGAERETVKVEYNGSELMRHQAGEGSNTRPWMEKAAENGYHEKPGDEPATDAAERWDGFKTALKPATEYVVVARAPLGEDTVAANVQTHGTGALNIDGCRVNTDDKTARPAGTLSENTGLEGGSLSEAGRVNGGHDAGRYPANVVFDADAAEALDREVGELGVSKGVRGQTAPNGKYGQYGEEGNGKSVGKGDSGGPSRYFYTSKATRAERTLDGKIDNAHPTVKPQDLMEWLVKLVTAEEQTVLDPFAGSGTTGRACKSLNRAFVGIEKQPKWADVARVRCGLAPDDPTHIRDDDAQAGLAEF